MELFTYLMAKNDHNTSVKKDLFSYLLGKNQSGTYQEFTGTSISANNTKKGKMKVNLLGNTSQNTNAPLPSGYTRYTSVQDTNGTVYTATSTQIPAKRNSDNVFGLYNINTKTFITEV